jgi:hypothetical protein
VRITLSKNCEKEEEEEKEYLRALVLFLNSDHELKVISLHY